METDRYKTLSNGAVYDLEQKRIVSGAVLTSAEASALRAKRTEKRRQVIKQAANAAVQRADFHAAYGEDAYIAAIIETAMLKATTPDDPKAIEAGRFILTEAGETDKQTAESAVSIDDMRGLLRDIAAVARAVQSARQPAGQAAGQPTEAAE
jgi:hypothetical protein